MPHSDVAAVITVNCHSLSHTRPPRARLLFTAALGPEKYRANYRIAAASLQP